jgi:integrase
MARRLTELACQRAKAVPGKRVELFDGPGGVPGLALRITERGIKSWSVYYRVGGRLRRLTLGRFPELGLAETRRKARAALEQADRGVDPAGPPERRRGQDTVASVCADYVRLYQRRNKLRRVADVQRMLRGAVLPVLGARPIRSITRREVLDLVDEIAARAPVMANRVQSLLKRVFAWALNREIVEINPLLGLRPPAKERERARVLTDAELAAVWRAADEIGWAFGPITQLLALTGARRREVAGMRWSELDLERGTWTKPGERTKSSREHALPLAAAAVDLIARLPRVDGDDLVFPSRLGTGAVSGFSGAKARLDALSGVQDWTHHDLRRALASGLGRLGHAPHVVQEVLGHSQAAVLGVTSRYQRHRYEKEVRQALEDWAAHVAHVVAGGAKVIQLR